MVRQARFVTGSTMRHVIVMTMTGMIGLSFMFFVDAITLFWVSRLEDEALMAAMGYAWTIQFFTISIGVAFMIGATAVVSKFLGEEKFEEARKQTTVSAIWTFAILVCICALLVVFRYQALSLVGARGEILEIAARFLLISVPSMPIMGIGMIASGILRAEGDGWRAMMVTTSAGIVALFADPFFIFVLDMGIDGAALGISFSRLCATLLGLYFIIRVKNLAAMVQRADMQAYARPFFMIALPTIATQMASPTGNYFATRIMSDYGEAAVAGWAVLGRITVLAFGGVFALSGAIGGIVGQNYGAGRFDRVRSAYRDSLVFSTIYVLITWAILAACTDIIIRVFGLSEAAGEVVYAFTFITAGTFVFVGALYVSNASFNNLGRPLYSTLFNWIKDGVLMLPMCLMGGFYFGAPGVVYGQGVAWAISGIIAAIVGWRFISLVEDKAKSS